MSFARFRALATSSAGTISSWSGPLDNKYDVFFRAPHITFPPTSSLPFIHTHALPFAIQS